MVWKNDITGRRFVFAAPDTLEGPDVVVVPFPAAAWRKPQADGVIVHDCNPCMVKLEEESLEELSVSPQNIQPSSTLIVHNNKSEPVKVSGLVCAPGVTVLMYVGIEGYLKLGVTEASKQSSKKKG